MGDQPTVSIGMPVCNGEPYLQGALNALMALEYSNFELIVSDNGSTDGTSHICREYARRDRRMRYTKCDPVVDVFTNFNRVLRLATGTYFMWAAHDDLWEPGFLGSLVTALQANPNAVLASSRFDGINSMGCRVRTFRENWLKIFAASKFIQFAYMVLLDEAATLKANHVYGLMRTDTLRACGGMRRSNPSFSGEDVHTLLRMLGYGEFLFVDDLLFHYRIRSRIVREKEPLVAYALGRIAGQSRSHRGNLLLFVARNHALHAGMRAIIRRESPLSRSERFLLTAAAAAKEVWRLMLAVPVAALGELNVLHVGTPRRRLESGQ